MALLYRVEYSWSPATSDQQPYLEIVLPRPMPLHELKLYTPNGNLTACRVIAGGRTHEVRDNRMRFRRHDFEARDYDMFHLKIHAAWGAPSARLYQFRVYRDSFHEFLKKTKKNAGSQNA